MCARVRGGAAITAGTDRAVIATLCLTIVRLTPTRIEARAPIMRRPFVSALFTLSIACAQHAPEATRSGPVPNAQLRGDARALQAELLVARDLLRRASAGQVIVDSMYATPGQAPPSRTLEVRTPSRTQSLRDSLNVDRGPGGAFVIRLSKPEFDDTRVRITGTIDFPARQPGGYGYETVDYTLEGGGPVWTIRTRVQLGIT